MRESYELDARLWRKGRNAIAAVALAGWAALALGHRTGAAVEPSYLTAFAFTITTAVGALFFVMLQHVTGAAWSVTGRRMAENLAAAIPVGALLFLPVALWLPSLYEWARPNADPLLQMKQAYLNAPFFMVRAGVCFLVWSAWAVQLYRNSVAQDASGGTIERTRKAERWSAPGLIFLVVTVCIAAFDWLMSLEPHWYSTIFGVYVLAGAALAGFAAITVVLLALRSAGVMRASVNHEHYHDYGKWLFGLTVFWAYIAFCQYLLIWYANLPEETVWFRERTVGEWRIVGALLVLGHFFVPFLLLLSRGAKRRLPLLAGVAGWILLMHYVDLYWIAMPVFRHAHAGPQWTDLAALAAAAGTYALAFWYAARRSAVAPVGDLRFRRSLEFNNV